jgi:hypothetical protein
MGDTVGDCQWQVPVSLGDVIPFDCVHPALFFDSLSGTDAPL